MTEADFKPFSAAMGQLSVTLGKPLTAARISAYFDALDDVTLPRVLAAIDTARRIGDRFPTPGKLRQYAAAEAARASPVMPGLQPPPPVPDTVRAWLESHEIEMPLGTIEHPMLDSYRREAASCGQRPACQTGECVEQVPVPVVVEQYDPPRLDCRYRWCQHHATRCAQRAERRVQREQQPAWRQEQRA